MKSPQLSKILFFSVRELDQSIRHSLHSRKPSLKTIAPVHINGRREDKTLERLIDLVEATKGRI
jgi:hypothetical protein